MLDHLTPVALWLIPMAPLAASVVTALAGGRWLGPRSHWPCLAGIALSLAAALFVLFLGLPAAAAGSGVGRMTVVVGGYEWVRVGAVDVSLQLRVDALGAIMLSMVTLVSLLVAIYSAGYMHGDPGYRRFFAEVALFVFSMCMLVLAGSFLVLYVFWEGVGLCSYLLIGFWFRRPSAAAAARKAFLVNRIGDFGFLVGLFLVWRTFGTLEYDGVFGNLDRLQQLAANQPGLMVTLCLCLFLGAVGKSAQFPLHVWLPDAMEGPSPVSALIHAATMVTAGVYMVARCTPLFVHAPLALLIVAGVGAWTALLAALIALTQNDLKRVLAYSTVSQLGFMFLALGCSAAGADVVTLAVTAAMFHLFTHAFFKALLFLSAGSVMHAMGDVIDMRRFGGLRRVLPVTHATFLCGAAALAGVPLLSGFWSKDEILLALEAGRQHAAYGGYFLVLQLAAVATALLTAFYTFRAYFLTFWGTERFPEEAGSHPHDAPPVMKWPLVILAGLALVIGAAVGPTGWFGGCLSRTAGLQGGPPHAGSWMPMVWGSTAAIVGIAAAALLYVVRPDWPARLAGALRAAYGWSLNKFYFDELYVAVVVRPVERFAWFCRLVDQYVVDGLVDFVGWIPRGLGGALRPMQNGLVSSYALVMLAALAVLVAAVLRAWAG